MEGDVHQAIRGEREEIQEADKKHRLSTFYQTKRCVFVNWFLLWPFAYYCINNVPNQVLID